MNINDYIDIGCKIATVIIALINIFFVINIFKRNKQRDLLKTLVLDYSIKHFYKYFEDMDNVLTQLKEIGDLDIQRKEEKKKEIEKEIQCFGREFEHKFIDLFLYINPAIHKKIKEKTDDMVSAIVTSMFDDGINIYVEKIYNERIASTMAITKSQIIRMLLEKLDKPTLKYFSKKT